MDNLLASNLSGIKNNSNCQAILGKTINSPKYGSCTVTTSGILAAWHLGGADACDGPVTGGYGDSDGHTTEADYICKHSGIAVPSECTVPPGGSGDYEVPATYYQIEIQVNQGDFVSALPPDAIKNWWVRGLQMMAEQFTATMMWQVEAFGMLLDAKHQLESQRLFQQQTAQAHRDYQPSEQMCTFATFTKDLAATQRLADMTKDTLATHGLQRDLGTGQFMGTTASSDSLSRIKTFRDRFCNPKDNANGLALLCPNAPPASTQNADIDFTRSIDRKMTLDINYTDKNVTDDEAAVSALLDNLFLNRPPSRMPAREMDDRRYQYHYMNYRSIVAMRGIARNTMASIIALKTSAPTDSGSGPYLKALMVDFGLTDSQIESFLGTNPSYYAQMEFLTKKIYQNPSFYTNLYDKPVNVERIRAAMTAIKLMQDRDIAQALERREMLMSMMLELRLRNQADKVYTTVDSTLFE